MANEEQTELEAALEPNDLETLSAQVKGVLDIQDRRHGFPPRTYAKCFVGSEAVKTLVDENIAGDEADAVRIGNLLLSAGVFHHVQHAHPFKSEYLFYRFASDEDHGTTELKPDGSSVSWSDFISPLTADADDTTSLQPDIPERDPSLAGMPQDDLEASGVSPWMNTISNYSTTYAQNHGSVRLRNPPTTWW